MSARTKNKRTLWSLIAVGSVAIIVGLLAVPYVQVVLRDVVQGPNWPTRELLKRTWPMQALPALISKYEAANARLPKDLSELKRYALATDELESSTINRDQQQNRIFDRAVLLHNYYLPDGQLRTWILAVLVPHTGRYDPFPEDQVYVCDSGGTASYRIDDAAKRYGHPLVDAAIRQDRQ